MGIDRAIDARARIAPCSLHQLVARENSSGLPHQCTEQSKLGRGEIKRGASIADPAAPLIDGPGRHAVRMGHGRTGRRSDHRRAAQYRLHPGRQLPRRKGLGEIVVAPDFEPDHSIDEFIARGQEDHWQLRVLPAKLPAEIEPVAIGQPHIQHHQRRRAFIQPGARRGDRAAPLRRKSLGAQGVHHRVRNGPLVVDDEDRGADNVGHG